MSFYKYLYLPTQHEIIFMNSKIKGSIKTKNADFEIIGKGYMEKDLGTRFPKKWLWLQTNCFLKNEISLILSKAKLIGPISGFFCFLNVNGKEYRFATYNASKINNKKKKDKIKIVLRRGKYRLEIVLKWKSGHMVVAPIKKARMKKRIEESTNSTLILSLYKDNKLILHDVGTNVSCEYTY